MEFLLPWRSHCAFDDQTLFRFLPDISPDTDDSAYDVSLLEFTAKIKSRFTPAESEALEKESKRTDEKKEVKQKQKPAPRKRGRPKKSDQAQPTPQPAQTAPQKKRGRPRGSRKPLVPFEARKVRKNAKVAVTIYPQGTSVFEADEDVPDDGPFQVTEK